MYRYDLIQKGNSNTGFWVHYYEGPQVWNDGSMNVAQVHHLTSSTASFPRLQKVRAQGSEFTYRYAHFPVRLFFINQKLVVGSHLRHFFVRKQAL